MLDYFKELRTGHPDICRSKFILWNDKEITIENKSIFWAHLFEKGICFVQDLSDENWGLSKYWDTGLAFYEKVCHVKQYYDWSKSTFPAKIVKQNCLGGSLSATKCYPYKAWPRNLSTISTLTNVVCMYAHTPMHTAEIWKKYIDVFVIS